MINEKTTRSWAEIDLNAIEHNLNVVRKNLNPHTMIMGVVKADGYGHGAVETAKTLLSANVDMLAVAERKEALELRKNGIKIPILILGAADKDDIPFIAENDITSTVFRYDYAKQLSDYCKKIGKTAKIHIKIDSGMSRIGYLGDSASVEEILKTAELANIFIEGIYSHFACADIKEGADEITKMQFDSFMGAVNILEQRGLKIPVKHIANSAAIARFPEYQLDMVRPGIVLYGYAPSCEVDFGQELVPAMTVKTKTTRIRMATRGTPVSYGFTYVTQKEKTKIATVPIGYADGYGRVFSNRAEMTAGGKNVPVIGRICMDQCMIDVSSVNNINVGDEVIVFGNGKNSTVTAESLASLAGTISYEILCTVGKRIPRVFIKDGKRW